MARAMSAASRKRDPRRAAHRHRRRRPCRPVLALALKRALRDGVEVVMGDPALKPRSARGHARLRHRRRARAGCWRRSASGTEVAAGGAADPRHGRSPTAASRTRCGRSSSPSHGEVEPGEPFAHMVEAGDLTAALVAACREAGVDLEAEGVTGFAHGHGRIARPLAGGEPCRRRFSSPPTAAARGCASRPASAGSPGHTGNPASSPPSPTSATTRAGRWSTSCPPVPSRSCR